jgi:hypothetical protein
VPTFNQRKRLYIIWAADGVHTAKHTEERRIIDMEKNGLLEIIAAHRTGDALDEIMAQDKDYQEALARQQAAFDRLDELELTKEQRSVIDQAITANNHFGAVYGAVAYRFGMGDGIRVRMEMEEIMRLPQ